MIVSLPLKSQLTKNMKQTLQRCLVVMVSVLILGTISCNKKPKDADIQASIESVLSADADMANMMVTVKDGVATLSGECKDEACKAKCEAAVAKVEGSYTNVMGLPTAKVYEFLTTLV